MSKETDRRDVCQVALDHLATQLELDGAAELDLDLDVRSAYGYDELHFLELLMELEEQCDVVVPEEDVWHLWEREHVSARTIIAFVEDAISLDD